MNSINIKKLEHRLINTNLKNNKSSSNKNFNEVLNSISAKGDIKFSKHAKERLVSRDINLSSLDLLNLNSALDMAKSKGIKDTLILLNNQAFIANVNSRTIITAIEQENSKGKTFTNIDGAVII